MGKSYFGAKAIFALGCILFGILLSGCRSNLIIGHYEGTIASKISGVSSQEPAQFEVFKQGSSEFVFHMRTQSGRTEKAKIQLKSSNQIVIEGDFVPGGLTTVFRMEAEGTERKTECFGNSNQDYDFEFCYNRRQFFLQILLHGETAQELTLSGFYFKNKRQFALEDPVSLSLTQVIDLALRQNFDSRIAYEKVVQARYAALAAYLNLIPHLTSNLVWNAAPNYVTFIATLQNLTPFLLPTYWLQARQAHTEQEMKEYAFQIMRANLISTAEELVYGLERDVSLFNSHFRFLHQLQDFQQQVERTALKPAERDTLTSFSSSMIRAVKSDLSDLLKLIRQDRHSLASVLGYHNIEAVRSIHIDREDFPIHLANPVDPLDVAQVAVERSLEVKQLEGLERISGLKKIENLFHWIDPTGDPKQGLGLNIIYQQRQFHSQFRDLKIQKEQTETLVFHNAYKLSLDYNEAIHSYYALSKELRDHEMDLDQILLDAIAGKVLDLETLKSQAKSQMGSFVAQHASLANYRIARAKKDRYLLGGFFAEMGPRLKTSIRLKREKSFLKSLFDRAVPL